MLLLFRKRIDQGGGKSPELDSNWLSRLCWAWIDPLLDLGTRRSIQESDLYELNNSDTAHVAYQAYETARRSIDNNSPTNTKYPTLNTLIRAFGSYYGRAMLIRPLFSVASIGQVFLLREILNTVSAHNSDLISFIPPWKIAFYPILMFIINAVSSLTFHWTFAVSMKAGLRVRAALSMAVYHKSLKLSTNITAIPQPDIKGKHISSNNLRGESAPSTSSTVPPTSTTEPASVPVSAPAPAPTSNSKASKKSFKLAAKEKDPSSSSPGKLTNLLTVDVQRVLDATMYTGHSLYGILELIITSGLLMLLIDPLGALLGILLLVSLIPLQFYLAKLIAKARRNAIKITDERIKQLSELLNCMKIVKYSAYESYFQHKVQAIRDDELKWLRISGAIKATNLAVFYIAPVFVILTTFAGYTLVFSRDTVLTSATVFSAQALFNNISRILLILPRGAAAWSEASISLKRLDVFFNFPELGSQGDLIKDPSDATALSIQNVSFGYIQAKNQAHTQDRNCDQLAEIKLTIDNASRAVLLSNISLRVNHRELCAVIGKVGSGKSTLLLGILREMHLLQGSIQALPNVVFAAQQPWIINATIRHNITLVDRDEQIDEHRYLRIIDACALTRDFEILQGGDLTEIGERGVNLSGGQKARICLARACYAVADLYLFDDPLSAVDANVSHHIRTNVLGPKGILADKARIVVTHSKALLPLADRVVLLDNGNIAFQGSYEQLSNQHQSFGDLVSESESEAESDSNSEISSQDKDKFSIDHSLEIESDRDPSVILQQVFTRGNQAEMAIAKSRLVVIEDRREGRIDSLVFKKYISAGGGLIALIAMGLLFSTTQAGKQVSEWWLAQWSTDGQNRLDSSSLVGANRFYTLILLLIGTLTLIFAIISSVLYVLLSIRASSKLHERLLDSVLHAPMAFFDINPVGRLLNRFGKDMDQIDDLLPLTSLDFVQALFIAFSAFVLIGIIFPWFFLLLVPLLFCYIYVQQIFLKTIREVKRLDGTTRSPIYARFSETLSGLVTIRSFRMENDLCRRFEGYIDANHRAFYVFLTTARWIGIRLDLISAIAVFGVSLFSLLFASHVNPGLAGVALTQSLVLTGLLQWGIRQAAETENLFTSVERIEDMAFNTPQERYSGEPAEDGWPVNGRIEFNNVSMRYRPELPLALHGISFVAQAGEKVAIIGRTGSGKTSITAVLFRIVECEKGRILVDNVDIEKLDLVCLRRNMVIVPQEPVLFNGTLRTNLNPAQEFSDAELWHGLRILDLEHMFNNGLDTRVEDQGSNFSVGERQIICLLRAMLRRTKIVVLDEASSAIDGETDEKIQRIIKDHFRECTVITIAHRLHTIMESDRVLVLDAGSVIENDHPSVLLSQENSTFSTMVAKENAAERNL